MSRTAVAPTVLITGASSGIGAAMAESFAHRGHATVLVARSAERLRALAASLRRTHGHKSTAIAADLSLPGGVDALVATLKRRRIAVDVLVNNAGVLAHGRFAELGAAPQRSMIDLNVTAPTLLIAALLPPMLARGHGRILNVASIAAFQPVPTLATYAAGKAYVLSLSEALAVELAGSGVTVTALCPGITATAMLDHAAADSPALARLPAFVVGEVAAVAEQGVEACLAGEAIVVPGVVNQAATLAARATPKWLLRRLSGVVARRSV